MPGNVADGGPGRQVQAVATSCEILETLRALDGAGVSELAAELDRSKATVHSHLATLVANEFVVGFNADERAATS